MARKKQTAKKSKRTQHAAMPVRLGTAGKAVKPEVENDSPFLRFPREVRLELPHGQRRYSSTHSCTGP